MASAAQRPADASNDKVIEITNSNGFFIRKLALKTGDDDNRNKVTAACVESLGFGVRTGSISLTWRCLRERSYVDDFVIFTSSARHDVHLNDATVEKIQVLERKVDPVFPVVRQKQSKGTQ
jgi:hypothetical protein